jgi:hypothetical protein
VPLQGFTPQAFADLSGDSFDVLYLYSRKWEPPSNWLVRFPYFQGVQERYFDYAPQISADALAARYGLRPLARFEQRGQWVKIYQKQ